MIVDEVPSEARLPTTHGEFNIRVFHESETGFDHVALTMGDMTGPDPVLMRVHSECLTGDAFGSLRCDCGPQLDAALKAIAEKGWGVVVYLRQEGRGIGLHAKIQAYHLQDQGADTVEANEKLGFNADERSYEMAKTMLDHLGVASVRLMTNNPRKIKALTDLGITVLEREAIQVGKNSHNDGYLATKASKLDHLLD